MKKAIVILFLSLVFSLRVIGQQDNELNDIILRSVRSYLHDYNEFAKPRNRDTIRYICADGIPRKFPFDSIPLIVFSERWMEGNPLPVKRELRHFCTAMDVFITTKDNTIDVFVRDYKIRRLRRRHIQTIVTMGGGKFYRYEYNCKENVWKLMDDL